MNNAHPPTNRKTYESTRAKPLKSKKYRNFRALAALTASSLAILATTHFIKDNYLSISRELSPKTHIDRTQQNLETAVNNINDLMPEVLRPYPIIRETSYPTNIDDNTHLSWRIRTLDYHGTHLDISRGNVYTLPNDAVIFLGDIPREFREKGKYDIVKGDVPVLGVFIRQDFAETLKSNDKLKQDFYSRLPIGTKPIIMSEQQEKLDHLNVHSLVDEKFATKYTTN